MSPSAQRVVARVAAIPAGLIVVASLAMLGWSDLKTRSVAVEDKQRIADLQEKVVADASLAPVLEQEQLRQSEARRHRKAWSTGVGLTAIWGAVVFFAAAKWLNTLRGRSPIPMSRLVQLGLPTAPAATTPKPPGGSADVAAASGDAFDFAFVDQLISRYGTSREAAIPILQAIQAHYRYLPDEALQRVCARTDITPAQIAGTSSFYAQFRRSPVGAHVVRVCHGTACHVNGARQITEELRRHLEIPDGEDTDGQRRFTLDEVACLGCCSLAPVLMIDEHTAGKLTPAAAREALNLVEMEQPA